MQQERLELADEVRVERNDAELQLRVRVARDEVEHIVPAGDLLQAEREWVQVDRHPPDHAVVRQRGGRRLGLSSTGARLRPIVCASAASGRCQRRSTKHLSGAEACSNSEGRRPSASKYQRGLHSRSHTDVCMSSRPDSPDPPVGRLALAHKRPRHERVRLDEAIERSLILRAHVLRAFHNHVHAERGRQSGRLWLLPRRSQVEPRLPLRPSARRLLRCAAAAADDEDCSSES